MEDEKQWGIETRAGGQLFRSRLEARWAMFFDLIGWRWTYEPFDADYYIPDFLIHGELPLIVEVKPHTTYAGCEAESARITPRLHSVEYEGDVLSVGSDPQMVGPLLTGLTQWGDTQLFAGTIDAGPFDGDHYADGALWCRCTWCGAIGVHAALDWYAVRPCSHYDGGSNIGPIAPGEEDWGGHSSTLEQMWREAGNKVRWTKRPPAPRDEI